VEALRLGLDPVKLDRHLAEIADRDGAKVINRKTGRRIGAIVCMHSFGHPVDIDAIAAVCAKYEIPFVEDAAESLGSTWKGRHCGTFGQIASLSFNGNKIVTTGGGGAILTNDSDLAKRAKHVSTTAKIPHGWRYDHDEVGYNYRLPNINAALGCAQLELLEDFVASKRRLAARYDAAFAGHNGFSFHRECDPGRSNYWLNAVLLPEEVTMEQRDHVLEAISRSNYMVRPAWSLLHKQAPYRDAPRMESLDTALMIERRLINLPSSADLA
jgi:perosamine synthetase